MANRAIKYRIYPTTEQAVFFAKTFGCCRKVYNLMLSDKIESYNTTGKFVSVTPAKYKKDYPFLKEVDSLALANVQMNLQTAFANCFDKTRKLKNGFPKYKSSKHSRKSYTTNCQYPKSSNKLKRPTIRLEDDKIILPKAGAVKVKLHRQPESNWILKSVTISQDSDGKFYASVLFEYDMDVILVSKTGTKAVGLDYKSDGLYMDSNGIKADMPKYYRKNSKKLVKEQRRLSRKTGSKKNETKSNNYLKQLKKVNKIHRHTANQRLDFLHKKSTEIANQYDAVCVETLNMKAVANKGFGNGKATLDNGYGLFLQMQEYKLHERGKYLVKVDKWYPSSQLCSNCGSRKKLSLGERTYQCTCGMHIDRDYNAAINIKREGLRMLYTEV